VEKAKASPKEARIVPLTNRNPNYTRYPNDPSCQNPQPAAVNSSKGSDNNLKLESKTIERFNKNKRNAVSEQSDNDFFNTVLDVYEEKSIDAVSNKLNRLQDSLMAGINSLRRTYKNEQSFQCDFSISCLGDALQEDNWNNTYVEGFQEKNTPELLNLRRKKMLEIGKIVHEINRLCEPSETVQSENNV
jgi:hypothetical protein